MSSLVSNRLLGAVFLAGFAAVSFAPAAVVVETFTSRSAFEARLGATTTVNFDDIATSGDAPVEFLADRYQASHGIQISGAGGSQYVSQTFDYPLEFPAPSSPNSYAPGPIGGTVNTTVATFFSLSSSPAVVAGFGLDFLDVDFFSDLSGLTIYDAISAELASQFVPVGLNGSVQFLGFITVDTVTNLPVGQIASVRFTTGGGGWPATTSVDGVSADNLTFSAPTAIPEPASAVALVGLSVLSLAVTARRSRRLG